MTYPSFLIPLLATALLVAFHPNGSHATQEDPIEADGDVLVMMRLEENGNLRHHAKLWVNYDKESQITFGDEGKQETFSVKVSKEEKGIVVDSYLKRADKVLLHPIAIITRGTNTSMTIRDRNSERVLTVAVWTMDNAPTVSLNFRDADVKVVIDMIARVSKENIIVSKRVKGSVSLSINNLNWFSVLQSVAKTHGYEILLENEGVMRVVHKEDISDIDGSKVNPNDYTYKYRGSKDPPKPKREY